MSKFTAVLKKDLLVNKKNLIIPYIIMAVFFLLMTTLILIQVGKMDYEFDDIYISFDEPSEAASYIANIFMLILPGFLSIIFTLLLAQSALNEDMRQNCELFHRSQPISIWKRTISKFMVAIVGNWLFLIVLGIVNLIITAIILTQFVPFHLGKALVGFAQAFIGFAKFNLIIGSLAFFCSAIFKDKAFLKGLAILVGIHVFLVILEIFMNISVPSPLSYFAKLLQDTSVNVNSSLNYNLQAFILDRWQSLILNSKVILQLAFCTLMYVVGTLIYKYREIK
ncbi:MAG: hypothetical protein SVM86_05575 [Candidatus Cloacimonadota bacterium]|nr:hypothetical protein [Candidatus Cloacimonadota bacterium]